MFSTPGQYTRRQGGNPCKITYLAGREEELKKPYAKEKTKTTKFYLPSLPLNSPFYSLWSALHHENCRRRCLSQGSCEEAGSYSQEQGPLSHSRLSIHRCPPFYTQHLMHYWRDQCATCLPIRGNSTSLCHCSLPLHTQPGYCTYPGCEVQEWFQCQLPWFVFGQSISGESWGDMVLRGSSPRIPLQFDLRPCPKICLSCFLRS